MSVPREISGVVTPEQWRALELGKLSPDARKMVTEIVVDSLKDEDPETADPDDIREALGIVEDLVDDLEEAAAEAPKLTSDDLIAAEQTSDAVLEDMAGGK
jgi:hypothetical protein